MKSVYFCIAIYTVFFHWVVFIGETMFWMTPAIYEFALQKFNIPVSIPLDQQAIVLQPLFINQGFYNLMLSVAGVLGFYNMVKKETTVGYCLINYMMLFAVVAGLILYITVNAVIGAMLQGTLPLIGLLIYFLNIKSFKSIKK